MVFYLFKKVKVYYCYFVLTVHILIYYLLSLYLVIFINVIINYNVFCDLLLKYLGTFFVFMFY